MKTLVLLVTVLCLEPGPSSASMTFSPFLRERREFGRHSLGISNPPVVLPGLYDARNKNDFANNPFVVVYEGNPDVDISGETDLPDTGEPIQLEFPEDLDIENMEVGERERDAINNLRSMEDFLKLFNLPPPPEEEEEEDDSNGIFARMGKDVVVDPVVSACEPKNLTVVLNLPKDPDFTFFPTCVHLMRCGGCCKGASISCQPTKRSPVTLKLLKVKKGYSFPESRTRNRPERRERRGNRARAVPQTSSSVARSRSKKALVTEHENIHEYNDVACKCQCKTKPEDCDPRIHSYSAADCLCRCKDKDAQVDCQNKSDTHYWDNKSCNCYCNSKDTCSTGQRFDHADCKCINFTGTLTSGLTGRSDGVSQDLPHGGSAGDPHASGPIHFD